MSNGLSKDKVRSSRSVDPPLPIFEFLRLRNCETMSDCPMRPFRSRVFVEAPCGWSSFEEAVLIGSLLSWRRSKVRNAVEQKTSASGSIALATGASKLRLIRICQNAFNTLSIKTAKTTFLFRLLFQDN